MIIRVKRQFVELEKSFSIRTLYKKIKNYKSGKIKSCDQQMCLRIDQAVSKTSIKLNKCFLKVCSSFVWQENIIEICLKFHANSNVCYAENK